MLIVTIVTTTTKLATSPVAADSPLATSRMMTKGLRKRARNCSQSGKCLTVAAVLGPYLVTRDCTSAAARPARVVASRVRSRSIGSVQISSGPGSPLVGSAAQSRCGALIFPGSPPRALARSQQASACRYSLSTNSLAVFMDPLTDFEPCPGFVQLISPAPDRPPAASKLRRSEPLGSPRSAPSPRAQRTASCGAIRITPCPGRVLPAPFPLG